MDIICGHLVVTIDSFFVPFTCKKAICPTQLLPDDCIFWGLIVIWNYSTPAIPSLYLCVCMS